MNQIAKYGVLAVIAAVVLCRSTAAAGSADMLQQALYAEEIEGDLPAAVAQYERIIQDPTAEPKHIVQALYRAGICLIELHEEGRAGVLLNRVVSDYPDQTDLVEKARNALDGLEYFDPAALMPPETLAYLELGSPSETIDRLMTLLAIAPDDELLAAGEVAEEEAVADSPQAMLASLANPSMLSELKKVRSLAVGCLDPDWQGETLSFIGVIHPGKSDVFRGIIIAAMGMTGQSQASMEGMTVLQMQNGLGFAYDDKVILAAYPREMLQWSIRHYKGLDTSPTLASTRSSFSRIDKETRRRNVATLWADIDGVYADIQQKVPDLPPQVRIIAGVANFASMDDLVITQAITDDGAALNATLNFHEGMQNLIYEMIRTPAIDRAGLAAVPSSAFALASFAPVDANAAQVQQLRMLLQNTLNLKIPSEVLENILQVDLFVLPGSATVPEGMPFRPGLAIACKDTGPVMEALQMLMANSPQPLPLVMMDTGTFILIALEQDVVDAANVALATRASVVEKGALAGVVADHMGRSEKMVLLSAGGLAQLVEDQAIQQDTADGGNDALKAREAFDEIVRVLEATSFAIYTDEQPESLSLQIELKGVPPLKVLMESMQQVQAVMNEIEQQQREAFIQAQQEERALRMEQLEKLVPARVRQTADAPVIDGEMDEAWRRAERYPVAKQDRGDSSEIDSPLPGSEFAAEFKMLWDKDNLYYLLDVTDNTPHHNPELEWYLNDSVALYIDAVDAKMDSLGSTDYQFVFLWDESNPSLTENQHGNMDGIEYAFRNTEKGYCIEVAFPWTTLGTPVPEVGTIIGTDVNVNDNQSGSGRNALIGWQDDTDNAWQYPYLWGRAVLVDADGTAPEAQPASTGVSDPKTEGRMPYPMVVKVGLLNSQVEIDGKPYVRYFVKSEQDDVAPESVVLTIQRNGEVIEALKLMTRDDPEAGPQPDYPWELLLPAGEEYLEGTELVHNQEPGKLAMALWMEAKSVKELVELQQDLRAVKEILKEAEE